MKHFVEIYRLYDLSTPHALREEREWIGRGKKA
jgi:hypothetical protein